jgi:hypothetical protein
MVADNDDALDGRGDQQQIPPYMAGIMEHVTEDVLAGEAVLVMVEYLVWHIAAAEGVFAGLRLYDVLAKVSPDADKAALVRAIAEQVPPERMRQLYRMTCIPFLVIDGVLVPDYRSAMPAMAEGEQLDNGHVFVF